jgi:predicted nuclease of predicted toxin-antitoxin system
VFPLAEAPPRLLFDENLAARLLRQLAALYPGSVHVREIGLNGADDQTIWDYARANGLVLVTKDEDFHRLSILLGPPPKVIWIRLGNCSTEDVLRSLRDNYREIEAFLRHNEAAFLALAGADEARRKDG